MAFSVVTVALGKLFPEVIGIPLTHFYKRYATQKVLSTGTGKMALVSVGALLGQDAVHKAGIDQYPKYQFEKWANEGSHPIGKPFVFKNNGPSWADNISKWRKPD